MGTSSRFSWMMFSRSRRSEKSWVSFTSGEQRYSQRKLGKPYFMCFRALLDAVFHSIRIGFGGSKLKIVDQKRLMVGLAKLAFNFCVGCVMATTTVTV